MTTRPEDLIEHMRAKLAACTEMIELGLALPGALREAENLRILLDIFEQIPQPPHMPSGKRGQDWGSA